VNSNAPPARNLAPPRIEPDPARFPKTPDPVPLPIGWGEGGPVTAGEYVRHIKRTCLSPMAT